MVSFLPGSPDPVFPSGRCLPFGLGGPNQEHPEEKFRETCTLQGKGYVMEFRTQDIAEHLDSLSHDARWQGVKHLLFDLAARVRVVPRWLACFSRPGCFSLSRDERLELVWDEFVSTTSVPELIDAGLPPPRASSVVVGLVVRSYAGALQMLIPFFRSVELFWPYWRWPVILVLDSESDEDRWMAVVAVPRWVQVVFEPEPPGSANWGQLQIKGASARGLQRAAWSQFHFDRYTDADYVAQMDADTVFHTWVDEELLFDTAMKPRMMGITNFNRFKPALRSLRLPTDIDFMAAQPMVMSRRHFEDTRRFVTERMEAKSFDEAFRLLTHEVLRNRTGIPEAGFYLPCQQSIMGAYLWEHHRSEYVWHVMWRSEFVSTRAWSSGCPYPKPPLLEHRCPQLLVGSHLGLWGRYDAVSLGEPVALKDVQAKSSASTTQGGIAYTMKAVELMLASLCGVRAALLAHRDPKVKRWLQHEVYNLRLPGVNEFADMVVTWARPSHSGMGAPADKASAKPLPLENSPAQLCQTVLRESKPSNLLLGIHNAFFWPDDKPTEWCTTRQELLEQWQYQVTRSFLQVYRRQLDSNQMMNNASTMSSYVRGSIRRD